MEGYRHLHPQRRRSLGAQEINDRDGATAIDIDDNYAPRAGFTWDVLDNGRSKLYGVLRPLLREHPAGHQRPRFRRRGDLLLLQLQPRSEQPDAAADARRPASRSSLLGGPTPVDPDLEGQYIDEALIGFEYEVAPNFALGIQGTFRELGR